MISGEERLLLANGEAQVVGRCGRGVKGLDRPTRPDHHVTVTQTDVGHELDVHTLGRVLAVAASLTDRVGG